ncbi:helix-turn-helix domain-containing protein [Clostridium magnum]|uniref:HTH-type transcriptional regulator CatM n=1 Tax=Clostridium magnum DSM 2767 TaxID=1121326 RepID=A0A162RF54_9CLOT|nr:LysR family transcriptional regulator [Clostridium magnum]KZL89811.1 HTH-type transcriptional regulator CatM [Clostridium magnum DSM 2767]SHI68988.1 regulatory helix-turn-helix protein, lysR family [Clostridium magnum DSM 2767]
MDLKKLNYIIAVAEEGNISKAAEKLYVSQPSLSKYIITIQEEVLIKAQEKARKDQIREEDVLQSVDAVRKYLSDFLKK